MVEKQPGFVIGRQVDRQGTFGGCVTGDGQRNALCIALEQHGRTHAQTKGGTVVVNDGDGLGAHAGSCRVGTPARWHIDRSGHMEGGVAVHVPVIHDTHRETHRTGALGKGQVIGRVDQTAVAVVRQAERHFAVVLGGTGQIARDSLRSRGLGHAERTELHTELRHIVVPELDAHPGGIVMDVQQFEYRVDMRIDGGVVDCFDMHDRRSAACRYADGLRISEPVACRAEHGKGHVLFRRLIQAERDVERRAFGHLRAIALEVQHRKGIVDDADGTVNGAIYSGFDMEGRQTVFIHHAVRRDLYRDMHAGRVGNEHRRRVERQTGVSYAELHRFLRNGATAAVEIDILGMVALFDPVGYLGEHLLADVQRSAACGGIVGGMLPCLAGFVVGIQLDTHIGFAVHAEYLRQFEHHHLGFGGADGERTAAQILAEGTDMALVGTVNEGYVRRPTGLQCERTLVLRYPTDGDLPAGHVLRLVRLHVMDDEIGRVLDIHLAVRPSGHDIAAVPECQYDLGQFEFIHIAFGYVTSRV